MHLTAAPRVLALGLVATAAGCGLGREPGFEDRTARVTLGERTTTYQVDACLLDGQTAYVVGRISDGAVVQAVIGVEADGSTGVPASTGVTVSAGGDTPGVAAFGPEAWQRRGGEGDPPGTISSARIRGSRIQAEGEAEFVDDEGRTTQPGTSPISFDARCDATERK